jgi:hypothetical protein
VIATPTTTVDVLRGTATDDYGDTVDTDTVAIPSVPASIIEQRQRPHQPRDGEDRNVRYFKGRVPRGTGVAKGDRLRDRTTGSVYVVESVYQQANPFWAQDQSMDLITTDSE